MKTYWQKHKIIFLVLIAIIVIFVAGYCYLRYQLIQNDFSPTQQIKDFLVKPFQLKTEINQATDKGMEVDNEKLEQGVSQEQDSESDIVLANKTNLSVPFVPQATHANWDDLHNDACEEAATIAVIKYIQGNQSISKDEADLEIQKSVAWQIENFGGHYDLPIEKTAELVEKLYNRESKILNDFTIQDMKTVIANGKLIILPLAGRVIGNPYFRQPGPVYHMLVVRGYDDERYEFITNDPGTKHGENYRYNYETLYNAIHDMPKWQQDKKSLEADPSMIFQGKKVMLIIE